MNVDDMDIAESSTSVVFQPRRSGVKRLSKGSKSSEDDSGDSSEGESGTVDEDTNQGQEQLDSGSEHSEHSDSDSSVENNVVENDAVDIVTHKRTLTRSKVKRSSTGELSEGSDSESEMDIGSMTTSGKVGAKRKRQTEDKENDNGERKGMIKGKQRTQEEKIMADADSTKTSVTRKGGKITKVRVNSYSFP